MGYPGRPDRIVKTENGIVPVELKSGTAPKLGPHEAHLAQLAVYCLLLEEQFRTTVSEGIIKYSDRPVSVKFDARTRAWILRLIEEVRETKRHNGRPKRSHNHAGRCRGCGSQDRPEALA